MDTEDQQFWFISKLSNIGLGLLSSTVICKICFSASVSCFSCVLDFTGQDLKFNHLTVCLHGRQGSYLEKAMFHELCRHCTLRLNALTCYKETNEFQHSHTNSSEIVDFIEQSLWLLLLFLYFYFFSILFFFNERDTREKDRERNQISAQV